MVQQQEVYSYLMAVMELITEFDTSTVDQRSQLVQNNEANKPSLEHPSRLSQSLHVSTSGMEGTPRPPTSPIPDRSPSPTDSRRQLQNTTHFLDDSARSQEQI